MTTTPQAALLSAQEVGEQAEYWGSLAQQKADKDAALGVSMPVSYYASTVVGAVLAKLQPAQAAQSEPVARWITHARL